MLRKILSLDSNFEDKRRNPIIDKVTDDIFIIENFLPHFYENLLEHVFLSNDILHWQKQENIAWDDSSLSKDKIRIGYSHIMADDKTSFPYPKSEAFHFVFPMVVTAFDCVGIEVKNFIMSRAFLTEPIYNDAEPTHIDYPHEHWTCLYYPHTVDGDTNFMKEFYPDITIDDAKNTNFNMIASVTPKKGRCVLFDGYRYHNSYRSKTEKRVVINSNVII